MNYRLDGVRQFSPVPAEPEPEPKCSVCGISDSDYDADESDWKDGLFPDGAVLHKYSDGYGCKPCSDGNLEPGTPWDDAESSPIDDVRRAIDQMDRGQVPNPVKATASYHIYDRKCEFNFTRCML